MKGKTLATVDYLVHRTDLPFSSGVMSCSLPPKFKIPQMEALNGTKDPLDLLETYKTLMHLQAIPGEIMCKAFPTTLKSSIQIWLKKI